MKTKEALDRLEAARLACEQAFLDRDWVAMGTALDELRHAVAAVEVEETP